MKHNVMPTRQRGLKLGSRLSGLGEKFKGSGETLKGVKPLKLILILLVLFVAFPFIAALVQVLMVAGWAANSMATDFREKSPSIPWQDPLVEEDYKEEETDIQSTGAKTSFTAEEIQTLFQQYSVNKPTTFIVLPDGTRKPFRFTRVDLTDWSEDTVVMKPVERVWTQRMSRVNLALLNPDTWQLHVDFPQSSFWFPARIPGLGPLSPEDTFGPGQLTALGPNRHVAIEAQAHQDYNTPLLTFQLTARDGCSPNKRVRFVTEGDFPAGSVIDWGSLPHPKNYRLEVAVCFSFPESRYGETNPIPQELGFAPIHPVLMNRSPGEILVIDHGAGREGTLLVGRQEGEDTYGQKLVTADTEFRSDHAIFKQDFGVDPHLHVTMPGTDIPADLVGWEEDRIPQFVHCEVVITISPR